MQNRTCQLDEFRCNNGQCIVNKALVCNGKNDCEDNSDEDIIMCKVC